MSACRLRPRRSGSAGSSRAGRSARAPAGAAERRAVAGRDDARRTPPRRAAGRRPAPRRARSDPRPRRPARPPGTAGLRRCRTAGRAHGCARHRAFGHRRPAGRPAAGIGSPRPTSGGGLGPESRVAVGSIGVAVGRRWSGALEAAPGLRARMAGAPRKPRPAYGPGRGPGRGSIRGDCGRQRPRMPGARPSGAAARLWRPRSPRSKRRVARSPRGPAPTGRRRAVAAASPIAIRAFDPGPPRSFCLAEPEAAPRLPGDRLPPGAPAARPPGDREPAACHGAPGRHGVRRDRRATTESRTAPRARFEPTAGPPPDRLPPAVGRRRVRSSRVAAAASSDRPAARSAARALPPPPAPTSVRRRPTAVDRRPDRFRRRPLVLPPRPPPACRPPRSRTAGSPAGSSAPGRSAVPRPFAARPIGARLVPSPMDPRHEPSSAAGVRLVGHVRPAQPRLASPPLAVAGVLDHDAARQQFVAQPVRRRPVAIGTGPLAVVAGAPAISGSSVAASSGAIASTRSRSRIKAERTLGVAGRQRPRIDPAVHVADEVEQGRERSRHVEIVVERGLERVARRVEQPRAASGRRGRSSRYAGQRQQNRVQALDRRRGSGQGFVAVLEGGAVVDGDERIAKGTRRRRRRPGGRPTRATLPVDLAIFSPPICRCVPWSHVRTNGSPVAASLWAISSS